MKIKVLCLAIVALLISCSKNNDQSEISKPPQIPESVTYDVNNDSIDDFMITYAEGVWDGFEASGGFFSAQFNPIGENKIMQEYEENVSTTFLFSQIGDSIRRQAIAPQSWTNLGWFTYLHQGGDGIWPKEWQIESKNASNPYYVGVQIKEGDELVTGWLKLNIDKITGKIEILDSEFTSEDSLVIDR